MLENLTRTLPVSLTPEEFDAKAAELAALTFEIEQIIANKKAAMAEFKAQLDSRARLQKDLSTIVDKRAEWRDVECEQSINADKKLVEIIRLDIGEIVDTRGLTPRDIQNALEFTDLRVEGKE